MKRRKTMKDIRVTYRTHFEGVDEEPMENSFQIPVAEDVAKMLMEEPKIPIQIGRDLTKNEQCCKWFKQQILHMLCDIMTLQEGFFTELVSIEVMD